MKFSEAATGQKLRLECTLGEKVPPIESPESERFCNDAGCEFYGWNFRYRYYVGDGQFDYGHYSLSPDTEVWAVY